MPEATSHPSAEAITQVALDRFDTLSDREKAQTLVDAGILTPDGDVVERFRGLFQRTAGTPSVLANGSDARD